MPIRPSMRENARFSGKADAPPRLPADPPSASMRRSLAHRAGERSARNTQGGPLRIYYFT
jgi:hypothetical protein